MTKLQQETSKEENEDNLAYFTFGQNLRRKFDFFNGREGGNSIILFCKKRENMYLCKVWKLHYIAKVWEKEREREFYILPVQIYTTEVILNIVERG